MVFFCPVQNRFQYVFCTHFALARHIIAARRAVGDAAVVKYAVKIPGRSPLEPGIQRICVIIHHIHYNTEPLRMQYLYHFFHLPDAHLAMCRICGIGPLRYVVVHRIISPVELRIFSGLIDRTIVIGRHDLYMSNAQIFHISHSRRVDAVSIKRRVRACKCLIFSPVLFRKTTGRIPGKFLDMKFINDLLRAFFRRPVIFPSFRIRHLQVHCHAPSAVDTACICIGICGTHVLFSKHQGIIIIDSVQVFIKKAAPYPLIFFLHGDMCVCSTAVSLMIQIQGDTVCRRTPQFKRSPAVRTAHPQIIIIIYIMFPEFRA